MSFMISTSFRSGQSFHTRPLPVEMSNGNGIARHEGTLNGSRAEKTSIIKNTWVARRLNELGSSFYYEQNNNVPRAGDCTIVKVRKVANHSRVFTDDNRYSRLYNNDYLVGVVGSRYATDAFHATLIDPRSLHVLTNAGLFGTVCDQHSSTKAPTQIELIGYLIDEFGVRINIKDRFFQTGISVPNSVTPILVAGTGMNSGKTTSTARLARALVDAGHSVAVVKLTGSASHRDVHEFEATGADFTCDFSDYGFPSTYLTTPQEMEGLYSRMMTDAASHSPDFVLVEIADGVYQRETQFLLNSQLVSSTAAGIVLTAACAPSALSIVDAVQQSGWDPIAVTGLITNAPLFVQEFKARSRTPIADTSQGVQEICDLIVSRTQTRKFSTS